MATPDLNPTIVARGSGGDVVVACVRYLNTAPLIEGLSKASGVRIVPAVPSRMVDLVAGDGNRGPEADLGLVSLIDSVRCPVPLTLVPVGMIGCDGPTLTVRLFSAVPLDRVETLHADTDSHTSVVLAQVLLHALHRVRPRVVAFDARERVSRSGEGGASTPSLEEAWPQTLLLIGDKVVTDSPPAVRYPYQLDLGLAWREWTGLPFVYAMWMCRSDRSSERAVRVGAAMLDRQRRHNATRLDWIVARRAAEHRWPADLARRYLIEYLRYEVGPRERQAVERFFAEAAALGLVEPRRLEWLDAADGTEGLAADSAGDVAGARADG